MVAFRSREAMLAGFAGTAVMTAMMTMSSKTPLNNAPSMTLVQGSLLSDDRSRAKAIGTLTHVVFMGSVVFGMSYAALFRALRSDEWWVGAAIGAAHGMVSGSILPVMGRNHPKMEPAAAFTGGSTVERRDGALAIMRPGPFGKNWGKVTPVGFVIGHVVFGTVVARVYSALRDASGRRRT